MGASECVDVWVCQCLPSPVVGRHVPCVRAYVHTCVHTYIVRAGLHVRVGCLHVCIHACTHRACV